VTPFDPVALVMMLQAFYPSVTRTSLERAFRERPEYFAGGQLIGRLSDALRLPDGRIFDIVFAAWTAQSRWQALDVTHAAPGPDDPFPLDAGPLVEIDVDAALPPIGDPMFVPLVSGAIGEVQSLEGRMGDAATTIAVDTQPGGLGEQLDAALGDAQQAHWSAARALEGENVGDLIDTTDGLSRSIDSGREELPDPPTDGNEDLPPYDPGPRPPDPDIDGPTQPPV
jgi:hypothetical protein